MTQGVGIEQLTSTGRHKGQKTQLHISPKMFSLPKVFEEGTYFAISRYARRTDGAPERGVAALEKGGNGSLDVGVGMLPAGLPLVYCHTHLHRHRSACTSVVLSVTDTVNVASQALGSPFLKAPF